MVKIRDLKKAYGNHSVLNGLNMNIDAGEVYGFIGENGSGKTTTMNILTSLIPKNSGTITFNDQKIGPGKYFPIAYLPESPSLLNYMNAYEYLEYIAAACEYKGDITNRIKEILEVVGLEQAAKRRLGGYSRGMQQRAAMAAVMLADYDLVLLDEPTSALDPAGRADMMRLIQNMKNMGKTIILSTHILSDVERVADKVGILHGGVIKEEGTMPQLIAKHSDNVIAFEFEEIPETLPEKLSDLEYISDFRFIKNACFVKIKDDIKQGSKELFKMLGNSEYPVIRYQHQKPSLESIYLKTIITNIDQ